MKCIDREKRIERQRITGCAVPQRNLEHPYALDVNESTRALRRAIELDPSNATAHMMLGHGLSQLGQHVEARALMRRARELDPLFAMTYAMSSQIAFQAREYAEALEYARQAIAMYPQLWIAYMQLGQALEQTGDPAGALEALAAAERHSGGNSKPLALRGYIFGRLNRREEALAILAQLEAAAQTSYVPPHALALVNAGVNRKEEAARWLERALDENDVHLTFLHLDPKWDAWRNERLFQSILERCRFADAHET